MRRHIMTALATCTLTLGLHGSVLAVTAGPTCRAACAPRIEEQCGSLQRGFKKCKRKLVRACKGSDPVVACTTTADMTRALEDRILRVAADGSGAALDLTLCAAGSFVEEASTGGWSVRIVDGALALELDPDAGATRRRAVQRNAGGDVRLDGRRATSEDEDGACNDQPARPRPGDDGQGDQGPGADASGVTAALADKVLTISSDSFFSSGTIVETQEISLCASGSMRLLVTTITSSSAGTFSSEDAFEGTWSVTRANGAQVLELQTGEPEPRRLTVEVASGQILLDGQVADVAPNTECGGGQPGPGDGEADAVIGRLTQKLTDQVVVLEETNLGFGTRTTSIALCGSGRYLLEVEVSAAPGSVQRQIGSWELRLEQGQPALVLTADDGSEQVFVFTFDGTDVLMNGIPAQAGSSAAIAQVCPGL
jgi:hypothetical protein